MAFATSSLPEPVSPVTETVIFVFEAFSIIANTLSIGSLFPTMICEKSFSPNLLFQSFHFLFQSADFTQMKNRLFQSRSFVSSSLTI